MNAKSKTKAPEGAMAVGGVRLPSETLPKGRLCKWDEPEGLMGGTVREVDDQALTVKVLAFDGRTLTIPSGAVQPVGRQRGATPTHAACQRLKDEVAKSRRAAEEAARRALSQAEPAAKAREAELLARIAELESQAAAAKALAERQAKVIAVYKDVIVNKAIDPSDLAESVARLVDLVGEVVAR